VRPEAQNIAIPPFAPSLQWVGGEPPAVERLTALGSVLVHFFDFAQLNSVRALPYVTAWHERYSDAGLTVIGVHSPRFGFTRDAEAVASGVARLGISHPVAVDSEFRVWHDYGCRGWPSLFLWSRGGALDWFHFGEGEYEGTEGAIREAVADARPDVELPPPGEPLRDTDAPGALVIPPSEEIFPGGSPTEPWQATPDRPALDVEYAAGGAHAALEGEGELTLSLDAGTPKRITVEASGLYELATHPRHESHRIALRPSGGLRVWSVSFAPGVPRNPPAKGGG
jgi:hypothetical protein